MFFRRCKGRIDFGYLIYDFTCIYEGDYPININHLEYFIFLRIFQNMLNLLSTTKSISITTQRGIVKFIDQTPYSPDFWTILATLVSIISLYIVINDRIKRPKLSGKILSIISSPDASFSNTKNNIPYKVVGTIFVLKASITCTTKELVYENVSAEVIIEGKWYKAILFSPNNLILNFSEPHKDSNQSYQVKISSDELLIYNNILRVNSLNIFYIVLIVEGLNNINLDMLTLSFTTPKGTIHKTIIKPVNDMETFVEKDILHPISYNVSKKTQVKHPYNTYKISNTS